MSINRSILMKSSFFLAALLVATGSLPAQSAMTPGAGRSQLVVHQTEHPIFPHRLRELGVREGEARLLIEVDETGRLTDWMPIAYSHRPFVDAAAIALRKWRFEPARIDGEAVPSQVEVRFQFEERGVGFIAIDVGTHLLSRFDSSENYRVRTLKELDRIPTPLNVVQPPYVKSMADRGLTGSVTLEFYIDETGAVKMPSVVKSDHPELTAAAAVALRQWRFEPPQMSGQPVLVRARQTFNFAPGAK